jgi:hypothetical protein
MFFVHLEKILLWKCYLIDFLTWECKTTNIHVLVFIKKRIYSMLLWVETFVKTRAPFIKMLSTFTLSETIKAQDSLKGHSYEKCVRLSL